MLNIEKTLLEFKPLYKDGEIKNLADFFSHFQFNLNEKMFSFNVERTNLLSFIQFYRYLDFFYEHIQLNELKFNVSSNSDGNCVLDLTNNISENLRLVFDKRGFIYYTLTDEDIQVDRGDQILIAQGQACISNMFEKSYKIRRLLSLIQKVSLS